MSNWVLMEANNPNEGSSLYTVRKDTMDVTKSLDTLVTIEWQYEEMDENRFPAGEEREAIYNLDEWLDDFDAIQNIERVLVITGLGLREWVYYTDNFESWIEKFNLTLSEKPKVPIKISHSPDPQKEYWYKYAKHLNS